MIQKRLRGGFRHGAIRSMEAKRRSRVITMIHRQDSMNLLGFPIARYIDIEDSEKVLRAVRLTPPEMLGPVDPQLGGARAAIFPRRRCSRPWRPRTPIVTTRR